MGGRGAQRASGKPHSAWHLLGWLCGFQDAGFSTAVFTYWTSEPGSSCSDLKTVHEVSITGVGLHPSAHFQASTEPLVDNNALFISCFLWLSW